MSDLRDDEAPQRTPFWIIDDVSEARIIGKVLRRRFPSTFDILESSLEEADPLEVVYPGNPDEYSDVVCEVLVLLASENADLGQVDRTRLASVLKEGLARRFGEEADEARTVLAIDLILKRVKGESD